MSLFHTPDLNSLSFKDIEDFCKQGEPEGLQLDYKKECPKGNNLSKTFAAFSNTRGGLLIIGVEEDTKTGLPKSWTGIEDLAKTVETCYQAITNVEPLPSHEVVTVRKEKGTKGFVLVRIVEGSKTPYYRYNDANIWVRTGNVSDPISLASAEAQELLFKKRDGAELARENNEKQFKDINFAAIHQLNKELKAKIYEEAIKNQQEGRETTSSIYYRSQFGDDQSVPCSIIVQPYNPQRALMKVDELISRREEYSLKHSSISRDFPSAECKSVPYGVYDTKGVFDSGFFFVRHLFANGLVADYFDIKTDNKIHMGMMLSEIYASVKTAQQYYEVGGYSGSVLLKVKLSSPQKDKILPVMGDSLYGFSDNSSLFLSDYEFVFTTDTLVLSDQKKRLELFDSICSDIYTGFGIGSKYNFATIRDYMSKNSGYSWGDDFKTS